MKTGNSSKFTKTLAQLLIDAKGRGLHWLGGLARTGFVSKKALRQISHFRESRHVQPRIAPGADFDIRYTLRGRIRAADSARSS